MGRIICWLNRSRSNAVTCQTKSWRLIVGLFCPTETSRFILFLFFFKKKQLFCCRFIDSPACRVQSVSGVRTSHQRDAKGSANRSRFLCFQFFKCFDMSRFFFGFFSIRTEPNPRHPHAICSSSTSSSASQLTSRRRPEAKKSWILMIISPSRLPFRDV